MVECKHSDTLRKLASLAKIALSEEEFNIICGDLERTAEFLRSIGEIGRRLNVEPLYHVWDVQGPLRDLGEPRTIDIRELPVDVKDGYVKIPWRGGRVEEV